MRRDVADRRIIETDVVAGRSVQAHDGAHGRGLAGPIRAEQADNGVLAHAQAHPPESFDLAVEGMHGVELKQHPQPPDMLQ
jgi:hypothetical protein